MADFREAFVGIGVAKPKNVIAVADFGLHSPEAHGSIGRLGNSDDETVDQHAVSPVQ